MIKRIRRIVFTVLVFFSSSNVKAQLNYEWGDSLGGNGLFDVIKAVNNDDSGNIYITGFFHITSDFDPGPGIANLVPYNYSESIFIAKYDNSGGYVWAKCIGTDSVDAGGISLYVDASDNAYICGYFHDTVDFDPGSGIQNLISNGIYDVFIAKYDSSGNYLWAENIGGKYQDDIFEIDGDAYGNIYITGRFGDTVDFDPGLPVFNLIGQGNSFWMFIAKYDSSGNFSWARGSGSLGEGRGIDVDAWGNSYITGNFGGSTIIAKYDSAGNNVWSKYLSAGGPGQSIAINDSDNIFISGFFSGTVDFDPGPGTAFITGNDMLFIARYDSSGNYIYAKGIGSSGNGYVQPVELQVDSSDNVYVTANFLGGNLDFNPGTGIDTLSSINGNIIISKYDSQGNYLWVNQLSQSNQSWPTALKVDVYNNVYFAGLSTGSIDMDPGIGTAMKYGPGIFLAKYSQGVTGISDNIMSSSIFKIFPNPATGTIQLTLPVRQAGSSTKHNAPLECEIINMMGERVYEAPLPASPRGGEGSYAVLDVSFLAKGIYVVRVGDGERWENKKLVVE